MIFFGGLGQTQSLEWGLGGITGVNLWCCFQVPTLDSHFE